MNDKITITINRDDLFSLIAATDNYRSHWFENWLESDDVVDRLVYDRIKGLCNTIKEQTDENAQLAT
mgnify:CR=1 FL=1